MKLFICEKPSQAQDIARELQAIKRHDGYLSNDAGSIAVTWAFGHLVEQFSPEKYQPEWKTWALETLPIIPQRWEVGPKKESAKQFKIVQQLIKKASQIVISTDADREGEMIARELLDLANYRGPIQRCWLSALDSESIQNALRHLKPGSETETLYYAGLARSRADWLTGINFSRLFTLLAQQKGYSGSPLSVGRVQSPTLALVVNRDREIANFKPQNHYLLQVELGTSNNEHFNAQLSIPEQFLDENNRCLEEQYPRQAALQISQSGQAQVIQVETKREKKAAPLLFALSDLQTECNRLFGMGAQKVLDIAQSLYETHKATTYPRTDCGYLPVSQHSEAPAVIKAIMQSDKSMEKILPHLNLSQKSRAWDDKKITAHHGIIPTMKAVDLTQFNSDEMKVYDLIRRRYLAQFLPLAENDKTTATLTSNGYTLIAKGDVVIAKGWKVLFSQSQDTDENEHESEQGNKSQILPVLEAKQYCRVLNTDVRTLQTTPPAHFTEGTLLSAMKNAARFVTDPRLKQRLRETEGLGTEATRAGIIQGLIDKGFLKKKGKQLLATEQANTLIDSLPELLKNPGLTALWEQALNQIAERTLTLDAFMEKQNVFIRQLLQSCLQKGMSLGNIEIKKCAKCGSPMIKRNGKNVAFWGCSQYPKCDGIENIGTTKKQHFKKYNRRSK